MTNANTFYIANELKHFSQVDQWEQFLQVTDENTYGKDNQSEYFLQHDIICFQDNQREHLAGNWSGGKSVQCSAATITGINSA